MAFPFHFRLGLWEEVRPELRALFAEATLGFARIVIIAIPQLAIRALTLIGTDADLITIISFLEKWATVVVFTAFLLGVVSRACFALIRRYRP